MERIYPLLLLMLVSLVYPEVIKGDNIKTDYFRTRLADSRINRQERLNVIDSLIKYSDTAVYSLYCDKARMLDEEGDYAAAMETYRLLRDILPSDSLRLRLFAEARIGIMNFTLSNFRGALESVYRVLETPKPDSLLYIDHYAYFALIDFYTTAGNYPLARKYIDLGMASLKKIPESKNFSKAEKDRFSGVWHRTLASHYLAVGQLDKAYTELKEAEKYPVREDGIMTAYVIYAAIAKKKGENKMAEDYLQKALDIESDNFNKAFVLVNYMHLLLDAGRAKEAISLPDKYPEIITKVTNSPFEPQYLSALSRYYSSVGDRDRENAVLHRIITAKDSIYQATVIWDAKELANHYENERREYLIAGLKKESRQRMWLMLAAGFIGVLAVTVAFYLWRQRRKARFDAEMLGNKIITQETQHKEELKKSSDSLTLRNQELASMAMYMAHLDEAISQINRVLHNKLRPEKEKIDTIASVVNDLSHQDNVWDVFRTYCESVNQSFFNNLYKNHPDLTNGEVRMCAFILLGLSNKEIATMTNRSVRTVEVVKRNIRKKFGITESTESYIRSLAASDPTG